MGEEASVSCGWRHLLGIWLSLMAGMVLCLVLTGRSDLVLTFQAPLVLTLGSGALIGLSGICVWGLFFLVPMGCLYHAWVHGRERWWRLLPAASLLMALLGILGLTMMGVPLPMSESATGLGSLFEAPKEPSPEELSAAYDVTVKAWGVCWRAGLAVLALLVIQLTAVCGCRRSWNGIKGYASRLREHSRALREQSRREEEERKAAREKAQAAEGK